MPAYQYNKKFQYIFLMVGYVSYVLVFLTFFGSVGWAIAPLVFIPVAIGSWISGIWGGILTTTLCILTNITLPAIFGHSLEDFVTSPGNVVGSLALYLLSVIVSRISTATRERGETLIALEKQLRQLTALNEVAVISTQVDTIDQLIERVTEIIGRNLFPDNFGILLVDEEKGVLRPHPSYRFVAAQDLVPAEIEIGQGVTGQVARTGQPIRIGNVNHIKGYLDVDRRTSSELCVPIKLKDRVLGVINSESTRAEAFSLDDELLLGTLAGQLATAIEQLRSAQAERQWLDKLAHSNSLIYALAHITTHIEKAVSREDIVHAASEELNKIGITCLMALYDQERSLFVINFTSLDSQVLEQMENGTGYPLLESAFSRERLNFVLTMEDTLRSASPTNPQQEIELFFTQRRQKGVPEILLGIGIAPRTEVLRFPLVLGEEMQGILWMWGRDISKEDLPVLYIFAKQIGISLERARLFMEVQRLALTDSLTGLQNRRGLFELGHIEISRAHRMERPFSCMMLDLDHFKKINDEYGHAIGDQVLQQFAALCEKSIRDIDMLGRYGGEEFVIFLPETGLDRALQIAERLRVLVERTAVRTSNLEVNLTVSIGVSTKDENTFELEMLIARADQAMYIAKHKGRNQVAVSR